MYPVKGIIQLGRNSVIMSIKPENLSVNIHKMKTNKSWSHKLCKSKNAPKDSKFLLSK